MKLCKKIFCKKFEFFLQKKNFWWKKMNSTKICSNVADPDPKLNADPGLSLGPDPDFNAAKEFSWLLAIFFGFPACLIIVVTIFGNFLVLCFKAKVGKSQTSLLIWNLGLADFLVGIVVLPIGVAYVIGRRWAFGELMCKIWVSCDVIFCTASVVTLCVISLDRYIGVTRPLK